jgi:RHS repeat-associated protein
MTDSADDPSSPHGKVWSDKVTQSVTQQGSRIQVTVRADAAWLASPQRKYPVVVDPTIKIEPTPTTGQDTMILSDAPTTNYNSSWRLSVGTTDTGAARSLVKFPLTGVPPGTQLDSAQLKLYYDQTHTTYAYDVPIEARRVTAAWAEDTATWSSMNTRFAEQGANVEQIDDGDAGKTSFTGAWPYSTNGTFTQHAVNQDYQYNKGGPVGETFTWVPRLTEAGSYQVDAHYVTYTDRATNAPYTVYRSGGTNTVAVNQSGSLGGRWTTLGTWPFVAGNSHKVVLGDVSDSTKVVAADAVRFTKPAVDTKRAAISSVWNTFSVRNIVQAWLDGTQPNHGLMVKATDEATLGRGGPRYEAAEYAYGGETDNRPKLLLTWGRPGVTLSPPTTITATGAQLDWTAYQDPSGASGDDLVEYQLHRSVYQSFVPGPSTLVAPIPAGTTSYLDTSATPTPADSPDPFGNAFYYMLVVKTRDGQLIPAPTQLVRLPKAGRVTKIYQGSAIDTTLAAARRDENVDVYDGDPYVGVGNNSTYYGDTRGVVKFPSLPGVPAGARVLDAQLKLWTVYNYGATTGQLDVHALTRSFSETTATWNRASSATAWTTPGGDYTPAAASSVTGVTDNPGWQSWTTTGIVQGWLADPTTNHGLLVKMRDEVASTQRVMLLSGEGAEPLLRPKLVVTYLEKTPEQTYYAPTTPERMSAGGSYTVPVTVTNTTTSDLRAADYQVTYKWMRPDGVTDETNASNQVKTALPQDLSPGEAVTVNATVKAPTPPAAESGNQRLAYVPTWDLYNPTTAKYLSEVAGGVAGLGQKVGVERPTSNELGLEKFYQYVGKNTGAGTAALVNQHAGNLVWSYDPIANPSRGPDTFLRLTYNSQDTSASSMGFGWSLSGASLMRQGTPLDFHPPGQEWPTTIRLTDGDGTTHTFTLNQHGSSDPNLWDYDHPLGVHLYLQKTGSGDSSRAWVVTRPDRTQFYFDADGYQTVTRDNTGNELLFTYEHRKSNNKPIKFLKYLTDAAGRQTLTLSHYAKGQAYSYYDSTTGQKVSATNLTNPHIIDQVQTITDISGRQLKLIYSDKGLLKELVDGVGDTQAKTFLFDYDMTQGNKNVKLVKVTDPRAVAGGASPKPATTLAYYSPPGDDPKFHWWAKTITDRFNHPTGFAWVDPDGPQGSAMESTVTDAEEHATFFRTDGFGRPVLTRDAKQQETALAWDGDHNVTRLQEANGAVSTWTYDPKTGFPLTITDAQANADGTAPTTLTYQSTLNGFVAELTEKRSPEGRRWAFGYDTFGNLTSVTDPKGTATPAVPDDFVTGYEYDPLGQLTKSTDANEHATLFSGYDANGYPQTITDARTKPTVFTYDVRGNVLTVTDAKQKTTSQTYDVFGRPLETRVPKNEATGEFIITPAPEYDRNDNITRAIAPNGAVVTAVYDPADQVTSTELPRDATGDPVRVVAYTYDKVGNLRTQAEPKGTLTTGDPNDFVTTYTYDEIYQQTAVVNANGDRLSYAYDTVGNVTTIVDPRKNATADPNDFTTKYTYDKSHRLLTTTDAAGHTTATDYDLDGLVVSTTDQENNTTLVDLDERGMPREVRVPHDNPGGTMAYNTTRYEYDEVGNRTRVVTPRGVATTDDPDDFAIASVYDELNRVKEQLLPFDRDDAQLTTPDKVTSTYDDVGNLTEVSAPPSAGQTVRNVTRYTHWDNGWVKTATDPWGIATTYDYNPLGQQKSRTITSAGSSPSCTTSRDQCRAMSWTYFPDGKLATRSDDGIPVGRQVVLVDNSDSPNVAVAGTWPTATSGTGFHGVDYRTHAAGTGTATFTWKLQVPQSGTYEVFAWYPSGATATNAPYKVEHAAGSTTKPVNQTQGVGTWVSLGSFSFTEGDGGAGRQVVLSDNANGTVVADAVKLVRDNSADPDNERKSLTYKYDPNGNLVATTDTSPNARVDAYTVVYDGLNRVEEVNERTGGVAGTVRNTTRFTYDPNGNPATRSHDNEHAQYRYDPRDLVDQATIGKSASDPNPKVTSFTYTPRGQQLRETKANGNTVDYTYFLDGLLKTQVEKKANGTLVSSHTIAYDPNGHRRSDAAKTQNADNHAAYLDHVYAYTYDPRDRIRQVTKSAAGGGVLETESYTHDANNNVIAQTVDNVPTNFVYDRNRLLSATTGGTTAAYNYDPFGRLDKVTSGATVLERYLYDGFDRVTEHRKTNGQGGTDTTRYAYDPLDRTASRTKNAGAAGEERTDFNYLGLSGEVLSEEIAGQVQKSYQYSPWGQRLSQVKFTPGGGEEDSFYGYSPHSDVETLTNQAGDTRATYGYTAYGKDDTQAFTGIDKPDAQDPTREPYNVYRFNAKRFDPASGDYDMGFRDYDPGLNRFLSRDVYNGALADLDLGLSPWTMNRYGFAGGNPISFVELDGHRLPDEDMRELRKAGYTYIMGKGVVPLPGRDPSTWIGNLTPEQGKELARQFGLPADVGESLEKAFGEGQRTNLCIDDDISEVFGNERGDPVLRLNCVYNASAWTIQPTPNGLVLSPTSAPYLSSSGGGTTGGGRGRKGWIDNPELFKGEKPPTNRFGLYALFDRATGKFLKWGITADPMTRYSGGKISKREGGPIEITMSMVLHFPAKDYYASETVARKWETWLVERFPGPRNKESWAGSVTPTKTDLMALQMLLQQMP